MHKRYLYTVLVVLFDSTPALGLSKMSTKQWNDPHVSRNILVFVCSATWAAAFQITPEDAFCGYANLLFIIMLKLILLKKIDALIAILYY